MNDIPLSVGFEGSYVSATLTITFPPKLTAKVRATLRVFTKARFRVETVDARTRRITLNSSKSLSPSLLQFILSAFSHTYLQL